MSPSNENDAQFTHARTARAPTTSGPSSAIHGRRGLILAACMMATFMAAVESTIVAMAMPTIVAELGDFHLFSWVFAVYPLQDGEPQSHDTRPRSNFAD